MSNQIASSGFNVSVSSLDDAMKLASMLSASQLAPAAYRNKPEDTLVAMMMGNELGLNPMQSIQNLAVINGKPSIYGDAMLALVQNHPAFGGISESFDDETMTATCTVWRKGGEKHTQKFSRRDAESAKLWGKRGPWMDYPKRMLTMRARGFALRNQFADALLGLISAEEAQDIAPAAAEKDITPQTASTQSIEHRAYISEQQAQELEQLAAPFKGLIDKVKGAYNINTIAALDADKFEECKARINSFIGKNNADN